MALGFPPIPATLLGSEAREDFYNLSLADAVRLSANFPWGFDVPRLAGQGSPEQTGTMRKLIDGGVVDNTGIDTIRNLVQQIESLSNDRNQKHEALRFEAKQLRNELLRRGLILLEIDSGSKPSSSPLLETFPAIADPLSALTRAAHANATSVKAAHKDALTAAVERLWEHEDLDLDREASGMGEGGIASFSFVCNHSDDVMTAWALGPEDKAKLFASFLVEAEQVLPRLVDRFQLSIAADMEARAVGAAGESEYTEQILAELRDHHNAIDLEEQQTVQVRRETYKMLADSGHEQLGARQEMPPSLPEAPSVPEREGWVYLGHYDDTRGWVTNYFMLPSDKDPATLAASDVLFTGNRSNVRSDMPDAKATFGEVRDVLHRGETVKLVEPPQRWEGAGYVWAKVLYRTGREVVCSDQIAFITENIQMPLRYVHILWRSEPL